MNSPRTAFNALRQLARHLEQHHRLDGADARYFDTVLAPALSASGDLDAEVRPKLLTLLQATTIRRGVLEWCVPVLALEFGNIATATALAELMIRSPETSAVALQDVRTRLGDALQLYLQADREQRARIAASRPASPDPENAG